MARSSNGESDHEDGERDGQQIGKQPGYGNGAVKNIFHKSVSCDAPDPKSPDIGNIDRIHIEKERFLVFPIPAADYVETTARLFLRNQSTVSAIVSIRRRGWYPSSAVAFAWLMSALLRKVSRE
jgi:hypothetical protein